MIYSQKLSQFPEIEHGFTTKKEKWSSKDLVLAQQVHGTEIALVSKDEVGKIINGADGLMTDQVKVKIGVRTADCVPILFYEPERKIIAAVHAGWQGTLGRIVPKAVAAIEKLGGRREKTVAAIGPHIGLCCYDVSRERVELFCKEFGQDPRITADFDNGPHLDLAYVNFLQLLQAGMKREKIEVRPFCTSCQKDLFFSYRRSQKENEEFGEILSYLKINGNEV